MIQVKILDKSYAPLTTFNLGEINGLTYRNTMGQIGDASFVLDINNSKVTEENLRNYNRIEISTDGVINWVGYIIHKKINFNQVSVQCKELIGILGKRLVTNGYTMSGNAGVTISNLLNSINADEDTGISMGVTDVTTSINLTFNQQDVLSILQSISDTVGAQFKINPDRTLDFKTSVGNDISDEIRFEYNILQPQQANITNFDVDDSGENIVTRSYGVSNTLNSTQTDSALISKYGKLDIYNSFPQANSQTDLDNITHAKLMDTLFSPTINLVITEEDNFNIGDTVSIFLRNKLINIFDNYQILEKSVKIINSQKQISIKINSLPKTIADTIKILQVKVNSLETN